MLSGNIVIKKGWCDFDLYPAHEMYVEIATLETESCSVLFAVEKDTLNKPISALYWGQKISQKEYEEIKKEILNWSLQSVVVVYSKNKEKVTVERNHQAECGLYLLRKGSTLYLHWDPVELYQYIDTASEFLNIETTLARLNLDLLYSSYTIFKDIFRLPERGVAAFTKGDLFINRPDHIDPPKAVPLKDGVDPVVVFHDLLKNTISRWPIDGAQTCSVLSSGLDTTIVTYFLNEIIKEGPLKTFGYNSLDKHRDAITLMRKETIEKLGLIDSHSLIEESFNNAYKLNAKEKRWPSESQTPKEGLGDTMDTLLKNVDWKKLFKDSILCELGFIDREKLFEGVEIFKKTLSMNVAIKLMLALDLEISLNGLLKKKQLTN